MEIHSSYNRVILLFWLYIDLCKVRAIFPLCNVAGVVSDGGSGRGSCSADSTGSGSGSS